MSRHTLSTIYFHWRYPFSSNNRLSGTSIILLQWGCNISTRYHRNNLINDIAPKKMELGFPEMKSAHHSDDRLNNTVMFGFLEQAINTRFDNDGV